jgi:ribonuclease HI
MEEYAVYTDGGARGNPGPAACAFVVLNNKQEEVFSAGFYLGETTNNIAEYSAVLKAIEWLGGHPAKFYLDSELVVKQLRGEYRIKNLELRKLFGQIDAKKYSWNHVNREQNARADAIVNQTLDAQIANRKT